MATKFQLSIGRETRVTFMAECNFCNYWTGGYNRDEVKQNIMDHIFDEHEQ